MKSSAIIHRERVLTGGPKQTRKQLEEDLRTAVDAMAFELHYQPQTDIRTEQIRCFEALLRWNHPVQGYIAPTTFIPIAERLGLMNQIGEWVLGQATSEATSWPDRIRVAVNASASWFDRDALSAAVSVALQRSRLPPGRLELEITETSVVKDVAGAASTLARLRDIGVRIAMDDFGTGYSSLSHLRDLPFDKIKIDRSFIKRLGEGGVHIAVVRTIIALCANLGVTCVAEGVETQEQLAALIRENCAEAQGHLFGRASPPDTIPGLIAAQAFSPSAILRAGLVPPPAIEPAHQKPAPFFERIVQCANDIIIVTSPNLDPPGPVIQYVNPAFTRLTGYTAQETIGRSPRMLQGPGTSRTTLDAIAAGLRAGREVHEKVLNYAKSGAPYWLDLRIVPIADPGGTIIQFVAIERDVTLDKRRLDELEYVADRDTLTGVPNRRALMRTMDAELQGARLRGNRGPCVAYVDVDDFKRVNDTFGHTTGDAVLCGIADRLAENMRRMDMLGRLGGEEFAVCMPSTELPEAAAIAERLRRAAGSRPFDTPSGPVRVTISVGVAEAAPDEYNLADVLSRADRAMYVAKTSGRNRVHTIPPLPGVLD